MAEVGNLDIDLRVYFKIFHDDTVGDFWKI
jgi:hypothetical protein